MTAVIRSAELGDVDVLTPLLSEVQDLHVANRPETFRELGADEVAEMLRASLANPSTKIWVADVDGVARGYLTAVVRQIPQGPYSFERTWMELDSIGVHGAYRRRGVARALVKAALAHAEGAGIREVELASWAFNQSAHEAFGKLGFVPKVVRFEFDSSP
ncbi:MAG TPA: GNAT family N-acetyltransferase [Polyangiaceae bacterium]|nr:GNAT family N-acetyltransferase [Polyangiaceae bacterium]